MMMSGMLFGLGRKQVELLETWRAAHKCRLQGKLGAIGGQFEYSFTPTTVGVLAVVRCACGEKIDLTDHEEF